MKILDSPYFSTKEKRSPVSISSLVYLLISIGVSLQISGSNWDIVWHGIRNVESFFTPPHSVIYSGVALTIGSIIIGIIQAIIISDQRQQKIRSKKTVLLSLISLPLMLYKAQISLPLALKVSLIGGILQLTAGPFDFWWHTQFGFDGLLSPPHSILATGMLLAALGGLIGIHYKWNNNDKRNSLLLSLFYRISSAVAFGVFLMVAVGTVLLFTLPFSKGQYYDFNPNPLAAIVAASILIPFLIGLCLFIAAKKTSYRFSFRSSFVFTSIIAVIILIQSTTTITSNSYFVGLFPFYLLNILPALTVDILILRSWHHHHHYDRSSQEKEGKMTTMLLSSLPSSASTPFTRSNYMITNNKVKRCIIASMIVSVFFTTLFFPWTVDIYGSYFKYPSTMRTEEVLLYLLIPVIIPIVIPVSILASLSGGYIGSKLINDRNVMNKKISAS